MTIKVIAFGIAKDILGTREMSLKVENGTTVRALKKELSRQFPAFAELVSLSIAVQEEYQQDDFVLSDHAEVVLIPPVAGG